MRPGDAGRQAGSRKSMRLKHSEMPEKVSVRRDKMLHLMRRWLWGHNG